MFPALGARDADVVLEGLYHKGERGPALVVAAPHPRLGGSMHSPVVAEIAYSAARDGRPALRFNYRGVGGSQGRVSGGEAGDLTPEVDDFAAAVEELRATSGQRAIVAAGYSFGASVAALYAARDPEVLACILVAPATRMMAPPDLASLKMPLLIAAGSADTHVDWAPIRESLGQAVAARVVEIPDADHVFAIGLVELGREVQAFLAKVDPGPAMH